MKKVIISILAIIICLLPTAICESFSLHSGVTFGMTKEETISTERSNGFECQEKAAEASNTKAASLILVEGTIAGVPDSTVYYSIDQDGSIFASTYILGKGATNTDDDYYAIEETLTRKYGESRTWLPFAEQLGYEPIDALPDFCGIKLTKTPDYSSWLVQEDDGGYVVIVHYYIKDTMFGQSFLFNIVGYQKYSGEDFESIIGDKVNSPEKVQEQRNNDL